SLERVYWVVLDQAVDSQPRVQRVLEGVTALELRFLDKDGQWHNQWPPDPEQQPRRLPQALELKLQHRRYGQLTRLLRLPDAPAEAARQDGAGAEQETPAAQPTEPEQS
ncbi:MAG: type II secretion system minor pseudopilin GspJ, partial [Pseudomonas sp.]